jgi:hypothetical protein
MARPSLRAAAAAVIFVLLCVPTLTRAGQDLDFHGRSGVASGFSKSGNRPPDPIVIAADSRVQHLDAREIVRPVVGWLPLIDELLPASPTRTDFGPLRAPPSFPLS